MFARCPVPSVCMLRPLRAAGLAWLCGLIWLPAADDPRGFESLGVADGLSHNSVYGLLQDTDGFLWVATGAGLNRYHGHGFRTYLHDPDDPKSLSENACGRLALGADGRPWIGTWGGGLNRYNPEDETFERNKSSGSGNGAPAGPNVSG